MGTATQMHVTQIDATRIHPIAGRPAGAAMGGELRLTRRGRVVVLLAFLALVMGAVLALGGYSAASDTSGPAAPTRTVVVEDGDTLWGIAAQLAEGVDVRETVHELEELNALPGPELVEGQRLAVPTR